MNKLSAGLFAVLVAGAIGGGLTSGPPDQSAHKVDNPPQAPHPVGSAALAICEHYDTRRPAAERVSNPWSCLPKDPKATVLLATVPDPESTHLALYFDRSIESIVWAAADDGYAYETHWLPWAAQAEKDLVLLNDRLEGRARQVERRREPGVLVFRLRGTQTGENDKPLIVFLIGETPTSGVNKAAFSTAMEYAARFAPKMTEIPVLGPTYSGSFSSLAAVMQPYAKCGPKFRIISGTTTGFDAIQSFRNLTPFSATVENGKRAAYLLHKFIPENWDDGKAIATLSEDETEFGAQTLLQGPGHADDHHQWDLRYPRDIARLRNAFEQEEKAPSLEKTAQTPPYSLALNLRDDRPENDSVAAFSPRQSPASQKAVLDAIAVTLRRERANYAAITATDVLDGEFLARFLHRSCPNVVLLTFDSDLLFTEEVDHIPLTGLLSVTIYPLFNRNQHWTGDGSKRIHFSSMYSEGIYNAAAVLLRPAGFDRENLFDYESPGAELLGAPPVWLTVAGKDGYWPVALLDNSGDKDEPASSLLKPTYKSAAPPREAFHPDEPILGWFLLFWGLIFVAWMHGTCLLTVLWRSLPEGMRPDPRNSPGGALWTRSLDVFKKVRADLDRVFAAYPEQLRSTHRPFLIAASAAILLSIFIMEIALYRFPAGRWESMTSFYCTTGSVTMAMLATVIVLLAICPLDEPIGSALRVPLSARLASFAISAAVCAGSLFFIQAWLWLVFRDAPSGDPHMLGVFFAYRSLQITSGVSPVVPVMTVLACFYAWGWCQSRRESLVAHQIRIRLRSGQAWPAVALPADRTEKLNKRLEGYLSWHRILLTGFLLVVWWMFFWPATNLQAFDGTTFGRLFGSLYVLGYFVVFLTWVHLLSCWGAFRDYLQAIERHPMRQAFSLLRKEISWAPLVSAIREHSLLISTRIRDTLQALISSLTHGDARETDLLLALDEPFQTIQQIIGELEAMRSQLGVQGWQRYSLLQSKMDECAIVLAADLQNHEWRAGDSEAIRAACERDGKKEPLRQEDRVRVMKEEVIALRLLTYIRYLFRHLRNLFVFIIVGFSLLVISSETYPFRGQHWLGISSVVFFIVIGIGLAIVFAQIDRDRVLSRITDTRANEVGKTFFMRMAGYGLLPLLTILASQFPALNDFLFSWIKPVFEGLH